MVFHNKGITGRKRASKELGFGNISKKMEKEKSQLSIRAFFLLLVIVFLLIGIVFYLTEPAGSKKYVIGVLNPNTIEDEFNRGFISGLAEYGYIKGKNVEFRFFNNQETIDACLGNWIEDQVDLIVTLTTPGTQKAKEATRSDPIPVFFMMYDPVASGLIASLSRTGTNLTGIQLRGSTPKALEWLLKIVPECRRVLVPVKYDTPAAKQSVEDLIKTAQKLGVLLSMLEVQNEKHLKVALEQRQDHFDAVFIPHSIFISSHMQLITQYAIKKKIPIGDCAALYRQGSVVSYGLNRFSTGRQLSRMAYKVLRGEAVQNIPTEISDFYLGINLKTASSAAVRIDNSILMQADEIIR